MILWLILPPVIIGYIWGVRRIAWFLVNDMNSGQWERVDNGDIGFGIFMGLILGWSFPALILYSVGKPLFLRFVGKIGKRQLYRFLFSRPRYYETEEM